MDILIGKFFFAKNLQFQAADSVHFKKLIKDLRPGYSPPDRKTLSGKILTNVYNELTQQAKNVLSGSKVTLCLDGWSNINNDPIIASSIQYRDKVYLVNSIDTTGHPHTGENLAEIAEKEIQQAEERFGVNVVAFVTDNAENMKKMRRIISNTCEVISYGCAAHQMNLLSKDLAPSSIISKVTEIAKFFRNTHQPRAWLLGEGSKKPPMPSLVRWNSCVNVLQWYSDEWVKIKKIIDANIPYFSSHKGIQKNIKDLVLFQNVTDTIKFMRPIATALDKLQSNNVPVAEAVETWKDLMDSFREDAEAREWLEKTETRYINSVHNVWSVANILHPKYAGNPLSTSETQSAVNWVETKRPLMLEDFVNYIGGDKEEIKKSYAKLPNVKTANFLKAQQLLGIYPESLLDLSLEMLVLVPSSAGLERVFSTMGFIHTDLRNRLGTEKVHKLAFCMRLLNE